MKVIIKILIGVVLMALYSSVVMAQMPPVSAQSQVRSGSPIEKAPLPKLPLLKPLFDYPIRDTSFCVGHDKAYYLTGTTGPPDWWAVTGDIQV